MKKTILTAAAAAVLGAVAFTPTPASALFWIPLIMESKKDPNFKAVNPYAPVKVKKSKRSKKKM